jgi:hypothetical protein
MNHTFTPPFIIPMSSIICWQMAVVVGTLSMAAAL